MRESICPRCGSPSDEGLCFRCTLQSMQLLQCPPDVEVTVCSICGSIFQGNRWHPEERDLDQVLREAVISALRIHRDIENPRIELSIHQRGATRFMARIGLTGSFRGLEVEDGCLVTISLFRRACERCSKMAGSYFEGTVQLRGCDRLPGPHEMEGARRMAREMADAGYRKGDPLSFLQQVKEVKGGLDIVVGSTSLGRNIARSLQQRFGGELQETRKLVGCRDGRDIFRTTILVRLPHLQEGDIVFWRGSILEVTGSDTNRTKTLSIMDGTEVNLNPKEVEEAEILGSRDQAVTLLIVAVDDKGLEVLDPATYKTTFAMRPRHRQIIPGQEVRALWTKNGFLLLE